MVYIVQDNAEVPDVRDGHITANTQYGASVLMLEEMINCLPPACPIFCDDNKTVFIMIYKDVSGTSVVSTTKYYSRCKFGPAAFLALISNHTGDTKYRDIVKSIGNLLLNTKCNGRN